VIKNLKLVFVAGFIFIMLFSAISQAVTFDPPVSISKHKFPNESVEAFSARVLSIARSRDYNSLKPFFHWTWNDSYHSWGPEYPWSAVIAAKTDADIFIRVIAKSKEHKNVYSVGYYSLTEDGGPMHADLTIINDGSGYKLAVQANSSSTGEDFIPLGSDRKEIMAEFTKFGFKPVTDMNHVVHYQSLKGLNFRCAFHPENKTLEKLEQKIGDTWLNLYLVVFDLEGNPTVKFKNL
jgi:hypothetical protein